MLFPFYCRYAGTITGIGDVDPVRWPNSYWRSLKVEWDESAASERQERVSLWEIERFNSAAILPPLSLGQNPSQKRRPNKPTLGKISFSRMHTTIHYLSFLP
jgi:hypothetical protein